ncbi:alcohol-forming fatty acyl-CoA reductase-like isoform X2 [Telopea speciosissima]|uniref:alcohol-forming fatty acyl-CoA reductase-like isoform X2 n=1 Tax=Telopea speciosissima TaxID=54955 RepID=UPI001CC56F35|nr:alcohol-forming fatty acyl-CoA reductase-like isoform X2 [Telopea speciosissima]
MDFESIAKSLEHKNILITGTSGFLAKIFMEKVLRSQPNVKKLFILLRAENDTLAAQRLQNEVFGKKVFRVLKEEHGTGFGSFMSDKVTAVAGDISFENLGIKDSTLKEEMWGEINFIVNVAGNTTFDERYDVALSTNALGVKHICEFAKKCTKLELLFHVSTAYVTREREGIIFEKPFQKDETFGENHKLDVAVEQKLVQERLKGLQEEKATDEATKLAMQDLGLQRARLFGWANTYVFTKSIGEKLLGHLRGDLPVVILRPTIITSTYKEPFPGWIEGFRTIDSLIVSYGKGKLNHFLADPEAPLDVVPGDMVVNAMLATIAAHSCQRSQFIYHASTSTRNPLKNNAVVEFSYQYFSKNPCLGRDGMPVRVTKGSLLPTKASFNNLMTLQYKLPIQVLRVMNALSFQSLDNLYCNLNRKYNLITRFVELYEHFAFFKARFDDSNLEKLRVNTTDDNIASMKFYLDPKCINWEDYFINVHIPGLVQHSIK